MKKVLVAVFLGALVVACSKKTEDAGVESNVMLEEPVAVEEGPAQHEGLTLIQGMDCLTCHLIKKLQRNTLKRISTC